MIKKMIKEEKGFTLVELLAVIVILGIIVAIAIPAIGNVINKAGDEADKAEISMIVDAARLYEVQNGELTETGVTVKKLIDEKYIDERQGDLKDLHDKVVSRRASDGVMLFDGKEVGAEETGGEG
ncbi:competence type IV pilus major pilin ComGC [Amphibacillus xylanus]|uniref:Prepilin-type N-terminal cleavage/methylation domain-containing protein n=1 Tax=Amphibacillus xylanus (strain ATCC 51415 / DSM 6626 / JCM 7361 / LMG 17667 / NBRC 15112 / Ep01) TaxID=698758 RepID=K0J776_AMPXN|nr:prepilin-type N-terminal cleavage/methylation domain-containing protein [Amphibacillus xylanus]BAM47138.1 hypothetical protein AXY_10060 [Amphibacillus xylanus NBRC 15112]